MKNIIETVLHYYYFDRSNPQENKEYLELREKLDAMRLDIFDSISTTHRDFYNGKIAPLDGKVVHLETEFLFDNQWNCTEGLRIFDWSEAIHPNQKIKQGMWLEQTQEMKDIRNNTKKCGYCGKQSTGPEEFCTKCIGSEHLEESNLILLRMKPVSDASYRFPPLTPKELAWLRPQWELAQGLGVIDRQQKLASRRRQQVAALIPDAREKAAKNIAEAEIKTEAFTWLLDRRFREIENVIYYSHTGKFCFGWREPYGSKAAELRDSLKDFPFPYEVMK